MLEGLRSFEAVLEGQELGTYAGRLSLLHGKAQCPARAARRRALLEELSLRARIAKGEKSEAAGSAPRLRMLQSGALARGPSPICSAAPLGCHPGIGPCLERLTLGQQAASLTATQAAAHQSLPWLWQVANGFLSRGLPAAKLSIAGHKGNKKDALNDLPTATRTTSMRHPVLLHQEA